MKLPVLLITLCVGLMFFSAPAVAKIEIHPSVTFEEEYTDNLFLAEKDEEEDWITTFQPGVSIRYDGRPLDLTLDYSLKYQFYKNNSQLDKTDFEGAQRADLATTFFEGRPFTLGVNGSISRETLDEQDNSSETNELINKSTVYDLSINPQYKFPLGKSFSLVFGYIYDRTDHEDSRGIDFEEHSGQVSLVKQLSTNTEVSANYNYMMHQSEDEPEYDEQSYTLGLRQQLGPRTSIALEGGYSLVDFDNGQEEDTTDWLVDISYQISAPLSLSLLFSQEFTTSATQGVTKQREASFIAKYAKESLTASAGVYWDTSDYVLQLRQDESFGSRFALSFPWASNLTSTFNAEFEKAKFDDVTDEEVDRYNFGASLDYDYRRFLFTLEYDFDMDDSDINTNDYQSNTVTFRVSLRF